MDTSQSIHSWVIFNPKNKLFWNNTTGWGGKHSADSFDYKQKATANLPLDGVWIPCITKDPKTTDELIAILQEFPSGTHLRSLDEGDSIRLVCVMFGLLDTKREEETDDNDDGNSDLVTIVSASD